MVRVVADKAVQGLREEVEVPSPRGHDVAGEEGVRDRARSGQRGERGELCRVVLRIALVFRTASDALPPVHLAVVHRVELGFLRVVDVDHEIAGRRQRNRLACERLSARGRVAVTVVLNAELAENVVKGVILLQDHHHVLNGRRRARMSRIARGARLSLRSDARARFACAWNCVTVTLNRLAGKAIAVLSRPPHAARTPRPLLRQDSQFQISAS